MNKALAKEQLQCSSTTGDGRYEKTSNVPDIPFIDVARSYPAISDHSMVLPATDALSSDKFVS